MTPRELRFLAYLLLLLFAVASIWSTERRERMQLRRSETNLAEVRAIYEQRRERALERRVDQHEFIAEAYRYRDTLRSAQ